MSLAAEIDIKGLEDFERRAAALLDWDRVELMDGIGRTAQEQTRERIEVEKTAPDGTEWPKSSSSSTLFVSGTLSASIDYTASRDDVVVGSSLVYAAIHQFGGTIKAKKARALSFSVGGKQVFAKSVTIKARPYVGLSDENRADLEDAVEAFFADRLAS